MTKPLGKVARVDLFARFALTEGNPGPMRERLAELRQGTGVQRYLECLDILTEWEESQDQAPTNGDDSAPRDWTTIEHEAIEEAHRYRDKGYTTIDEPLKKELTNRLGVRHKIAFGTDQRRTLFAVSAGALEHVFGKNGTSGARY